MSDEASLRMALCWFAGGSKCDVAASHGLYSDHVLVKMWEVADAVNSKFTRTRVKQPKILGTSPGFSLTTVLGALMECWFGWNVLVPNH